MSVRILMLLTLTCAGCAAQTSPGADRGPSELDQLRTACRDRGGILTPIPGATTGRPAADFACEISGPPLRR